LGRSGQLKRNNKSCCNRYIFLRRKFVQRFQQNLLREYLGGAAFPQRHQQHHHHHQQRQQDGAPGSTSPALTFGGLSFDECRSVFLSPNARRPTAQASLAAAFSAAAASHAAALSTAHANPSSAVVLGTAPSHGAPSRAAAFSTAAADPIVATCAAAASVSSAGLFNAAFPNKAAAAVSSAAAPNLPMKRAREDWAGLMVDQSLSDLAGSGWARRTLRHSQSLKDNFRQQGWESSSMQAALWARVGSESALPDDVLLGSSCEDPHFNVSHAPLPVPLPAPLSAQPQALLSAPLPTQLAARTDSVTERISSFFGRPLSLENDSAAQDLVLPMGACRPAQEAYPLFLNAPMPHPSRPAPASRLPLATEPQGRALAACLPKPALLKSALEQGGAGEGVAQVQPYMHTLGQGVGVEGTTPPQKRHQQLNGRQFLQQGLNPSFSSHQPLPEPLLEPLTQPPPEPLPLEQSLALAPSQALLLSALSQQPLALDTTTNPPGAGCMPSVLSGSHIHPPTRPGRALLQMPYIPSASRVPFAPSHLQPRLPLPQEPLIPSPALTNQAPVPWPGMTDALGDDGALLHAMADPGLDPNVCASTHLIELGGATDVKPETGTWDGSMTVSNSWHEASGFPDTAMCPPGMPPSAHILQIHRGFNDQAIDVISYTNGILPYLSYQS
ncbi:hypothetical protein CLOM_g680, partial [Closterium sp. NIES-68]